MATRSATPRERSASPSPSASSSGKFVISHYDHLPDYDPGDFGDDTRFVRSLRECSKNWTVSPRQTDIADLIAANLEAREHRIRSEADLNETYTELAHYVAVVFTEQFGRRTPPGERQQAAGAS